MRSEDWLLELPIHHELNPFQISHNFTKKLLSVHSFARTTYLGSD